MMENRKLQELLEAVQRSNAVDLHTAMPGTVISYNATRNTVDVQPQLFPSLPDLDGDLETEVLSSIPDVPIAWPQGGGCSITWPLAKGDHVLLVFCEQDLGLWRANGQAAGTGDVRRHGLAGAVAVPGIQTVSGALGSSRVAMDAITLAPKVLLGSATATQAMIKGTAYRAAEDSMLSTMQSTFTALAGASTGALTPLAASFSALASAIGSFTAGASGYLSTKHKLDS